MSESSVESIIRSATKLSSKERQKLIDALAESGGAKPLAGKTAELRSGCKRHDEAAERRTGRGNCPAACPRRVALRLRSRGKSVRSPLRFPQLFRSDLDAELVTADRHEPEPLSSTESILLIR
jgi:hypothetical protein